MTNEALVSATLRAAGPLTQAELIRRTGLSRPTVTAILQVLRRQDVVQAAGTESGVQGRGRPGLLVAFNPRSLSVAAGLVLPDDLDVRIADADAVEIGRATGVSRRSPSATLRALARLIETSHRRTGAGPLGAATVLVPGQIDPETGICVSVPVLGWRNVAVRGAMEDLLGIPVAVLNPSTASALGAARSRSYPDLIMVFFDRGVGCGVVSGGSVLLGADGAAGEIGHARVAASTRRCRCGEIGCLETVASGWRIAERVAEVTGGTTHHLATLADLERLDDPLVDEILDDAANQLGWAVSWLVAAVNPTRVLLGGTSYAAGAARFQERFARALLDNAPAMNRAGLEVEAADVAADFGGGFQAALDLADKLAGPRPVQAS